MTAGRAVAAPAGALRLWIIAARPRTLPAAIAPVLVGTALAGTEDVFRPLAFVCALIGSVFIQIGTNLSNDYSDARRGVCIRLRHPMEIRHRQFIVSDKQDDAEAEIPNGEREEVESGAQVQDWHE